MLSLPLRRATIVGRRAKLAMNVRRREFDSLVPIIGVFPLQMRSITTGDVFRVSEVPISADIPPLPTPPLPGRSVDELFESGESVLGELGLLSWWKPSSYFRMALEGIHMHFDVPWWGTIITATVVLRLLLIGVPVMSQKLVAKQSKHRKELDEFRGRIEEARKEGNNLLQQQVLLEQRDFMKSKDIRMGRQMLVLLANGGVFATQFFAIKRMVEVNYPGLATGGTLWFPDLTAADSYYALPLISAATMALVTKVGIEMGTSADQMPPVMRLFMQYGLPVVIFGVSSQFSSALCVYWCTSNMMSLVYSAAFRTQAIRNVFGIPPIVPVDVGAAKKKKGAITEVFKNYKDNKGIPPSLADLKQKDAKSFKKAGRGKPIT